MNIIEYQNYNSSLGTLIDVQHPEDYEQGHDPRSINIYATCVKSYIADDQISHIINQIPDLYI